MAFLKQVSLKIQFVLKSLFFLQYLPQALVYCYLRDRAERQYLPSPTTAPTLSPGKLLQATSTPQGASFSFENAELNLEFLTSDFVRIDWFSGLPPIPYAIAPSTWETVSPQLEKHEQGWTLITNALKINISLTGHLSFFDPAGNLIREEHPPQQQGESWIHSANLRPEERIYGLGERSTSLNLRATKDKENRSKTYSIWNYDPGNIYEPGTDPMYICIPVYLGLHELGSYLIFYENSFRGEFTFSDSAVTQFEKGALRYYITIGDPSTLLERYTQLTGRAPLPPRWALGYHQSRWGYRTEATVRQEVETFKKHDLPLSGVHLDIDCQVNHRAFTIDPKRFPDFRGFTQDLGEMGVRLIAINNPGIKYSRQSNLFLEGQTLDAFCTYPNGELVIAPVWSGCTVFPDFTNPQVRSWWSRQFAYLLNVGVSGFWNDMSEPAVFILWGDPTLPKVAQHSLEGRGGDHREAHNLYGMLEAKSAFEGISQSRSQQRPFIVSRSGCAGLQRYAWTWTGDIVSTWDALRQTIATIIGLGLSGIAYSGSDIGGFLGNPNAELYLRWFQMATFCPFYRTHCATNVSPRAPWTYGEPYLTIMRNFMKLRYRLMPYFYTLAWETQEKGYPLVRPLFWFDKKNASLWDVQDGFGLGDGLLIYPILEPGATSRSVTLPKGEWYNFWNDTILQGGETITLESSLEEIPLFVKAGQILPMEEDNTLTLHLYPPKSGGKETLMYSDAGDGYGESRRDRFFLMRENNILELTWEQEGDYNFPYSAVILHLHGVSVQQIWIDEQEERMQGQKLHCKSFQRVRFRC